MKLVFDTSAFSAMQRGNSELLELVRSADEVIVPAVVIGELVAGYSYGTKLAENNRYLESFLRSDVTVQPVDILVAREYGSLYATLKKLGTPISINDVWIAASAKVAGGTLVTFDSDFAKVPALDVIILK